MPHETPPPETIPTDPNQPPEVPWYHLLNPCDIDRHPLLAPVGDIISELATECPCCNGFRMIAALVIGLVIGGII